MVSSTSTPNKQLSKTLTQLKDTNQKNLEIEFTTIVKTLEIEFTIIVTDSQLKILFLKVSDLRLPIQGLQRRMVLVVNFLLGFAVATFDLVHDVDTVFPLP